MHIVPKVANLYCTVYPSLATLSSAVSTLQLLWAFSRCYDGGYAPTWYCFGSCRHHQQTATAAYAA